MFWETLHFMFIMKTNFAYSTAQVGFVSKYKTKMFHQNKRVNFIIILYLFSDAYFILETSPTVIYNCNKKYCSYPSVDRLLHLIFCLFFSVVSKHGSSAWLWVLSHRVTEASALCCVPLILIHTILVHSDWKKRISSSLIGPRAKLLFKRTYMYIFYYNRAEKHFQSVWFSISSISHNFSGTV